MDLTANLEIFGAVELINLMSIYKKTGALFFLINGEEGIIYFSNGFAVHAIYKSLAGEEALYNLAIEKQGTVSYKDKQLVKEETIKQEDTSVLISQIEKRRVEFNDILDRLPQFDAVLEKRADGAGENINLRKSDWTVIRLVDGKRNIKTIIKDSRLPLLEVYKTLEYLLSKGLLFDKSQSEKMRKEFQKSINSILDVYAIKGSNTKDWANFLIDAVVNSGFETIGGMMKFSTDSIILDDSVDKVIDEDKIRRIKQMLFLKALEKGTEELGGMIAKKKNKELMQKEGVSDGNF